MKSMPEDLLLWKQRIDERTKSGMSVSEWCRKNEISKSKYNYWNNKIIKDKKLDSKIEFAEVSSNTSNTYEVKAIHFKSDDFQIFFRNVQVTVPSNFNQESLAGLMKVLQQL